MSNETPFAKAMREFNNLSEKKEGVSLQVLCAVIDMKSMVTMEWLKRYHTSEGADKTKLLEEILNLDPDYEEMTYYATLKKGDMSADPKEYKKQQDAKQIAVTKRVNAQQLMKNVLKAVVTFRAFDIVDRPVVTGKKRLEYVLVLKDDDGKEKNRDYSSTFSDLIRFGENQITQQEWNKGKVKITPSPINHVVKEGKPVGVTENPDKLLVATLQATTDLINRTEHPSMSVEAVKAMIVLARTALKKQFANSKGQIELEDLEIDFKGVFVTSQSTKQAA